MNDQTPPDESRPGQPNPGDALAAAFTATFNGITEAAHNIARELARIADAGQDEFALAPPPVELAPAELVSEPVRVVLDFTGADDELKQKVRRYAHENAIPTDPPAPGEWPRVFRLERDHDVSGVSGTGIVAHGVLWPDGSASLRWAGERPSAVHWDRLADAEHVHGHQGATRFVWLDEQPATGPGGHAVKAWQNAHGRATKAETELDYYQQLSAGQGQALSRAQAAREEQRQRAERAEAERDGAYRERAQLLALLACHYPAITTDAPDVDEDGWRLLYLALPTGQATWHITPRDTALFAHVERVPRDDPRTLWDGHTTEEKYERIGRLVDYLSDGSTCTCGERCANCRADDQTTED